MKFLFLVLLIAGIVNAQQQPASKIEEVTVYLSGAKITRTATTQVNSGSNQIILKGLSPDIDDSSIQVSNLDGLRLMGLSYEVKASEEKTKSNSYQTIQTRIDSANTAIQTIDAQLSGLNEELLLLQSNRSLNNADTGLTLVQVKSFGSYYNQRTEEIALAKSGLATRNTLLRNLLQDLKEDQNRLDPASNNMQGTIVLNLYSSSRKSVELQLSYNVGNAGWVPSYDLRANGKTEAISIDFRGQIYQQTGTDWKNVGIKLSTGDPNVDNTKPILEQKKLRFVNYNYNNSAAGRGSKRYNPTVQIVRGKVTDPDGQPILGTTVLVKGTNIATTTDFDGNYSLDVGQGKELIFTFSGYTPATTPIYSSIVNQQLSSSLDAVVVTSYRSSSKEKSNISSSVINEVSVISQVEDNIASRTFELSQKYTILSTGETTDISITSNTLESNLEYYAAPVINENVFLTAVLKDYEKLNLIPGDANVYFDDAYTGKIYFDTDTTDENLIISLGVDPQITLKREDKKDFKSKSFLGSTRILEKRYEITLKNNRNNNVTIKLQDRVPVSGNDDIKVDQVETGTAVMDEENSILTWTVELASGQQTKREFSYRIKYPKNKRINEN